MPANAPEVLTGTRPTGAQRMDLIRAAATRAERSAELAQAPIAAEGTTLYQSRYRRYRVQITAPGDVTDRYTGRVEKGKPIAAQFDDFYYVNAVKDPEVHKLIDDALMANFYYGLMSDFWLAKDKTAQIVKASIDSAVHAIRANMALIKDTQPEVMHDLLRELKAGGMFDWDLQNYAAEKLPKDGGELLQLEGRTQ